MLIKKVVIQGFKTFAKRTEFVFDPGITAVVGPNGSGKSNIVDAVRWCLGEQSFSLLRSKKTSDIIFSGSDKKARLGMAQVSLTLDNSAGEIPIDFVEVEITRRAYRDGDNEYQVNGQKVRLQDVTELLSHTGLGKRTYAVIGQGLIDRVLSLAPEERRSLFEEAAGITGYQAKRETTVRRLEATQQNLTRVRDIVAELAPRLGYMKRQAERAREREQMANDLRGLLREWYGFKWHAAIADVENYHADALILKNGMEDRQAEIYGVEERITALRAEQSALRAALGDQHRAGSDLHREAERVGRELAVAQERRRQVQERGEEARREVGPLLVQREALAERLDSLRAVAQQATAELETRRAERAEVESALAERRSEQDRLLAGVAAARRALESAVQQVTEHESRLSQSAERRQSLLRAQEGLQGGQTAAQAEAQTLLAQLAAAEESQRELENRAGALQSEIAAAEEQLRAARAELERAEAARRVADRDADRVQTRHDLLKRLSDEGAGLASGVKSVLQANLPGVLGVVVSLLRVPAQLDKAVETALGGALQNVVTQTWDQTQNAIDHLKRTQRGRATFLPLDRLHTSSAIPAPRMAGVLGNAAALVECDPRAAGARDHLLNRTWIVEDLPTARRALDAHRDGARPTVVTLGGEIVRPGGAVTGGSEGERRDDSVLARERELRELPAQVASARETAAKAAAACRSFATQIAESATSLEERRRALAELARTERTSRATLDDLRRRTDRAQQQARFLAEQQLTSEGELAALAERENEVQSALVFLREKRSAAVAALRAHETAVSHGSSDDLLHTLADRRAAEAEAAGILNSQRALLEQQERTLATLSTQISDKETRAVALLDEATTLGERLAALTATEAHLSAQIEALQGQIAPQEAHLAALESQQAAAETQERALQHSQRRDESTWAHTNLLLQRSEDVVAQLRSDIERDLGLVHLEQSDEVAYQPPLPWDAFVEQLPVRETLAEGLEEEVIALRARLGRLTNVNPDAPREYDEAAERCEYLTAQADDLESAAADLHRIIGDLDAVMQTELSRTFALVAVQFQHEFHKLFNGGAAELLLTDPDNIAQSGIDIVARPPGKRPQSLALLSGGERALTACALIFAILRVSPTPFCVLDEVDAALDEANVDRFRLSVEDLAQGTQFIIVTHNRRTLEGANTIYGVTMGNDGVSRVISLRLEGDSIVHAAAGPSAAPETDAADLAALEEVVQM